jgi:RNA polymerase sigma-70 factor (ECF subfamily)
MTTVEFEDAVREHKDRVYGYARSLLRDSEDARDAAQECLVKLWQHKDQVEPGAGCRSWLLRAAHNLCIDRIRRRTVRREVDPEESAELADARPGPERLAASSHAGQLLERALMGLGERDRAIVLLREIEGLRYEEIAEILGMNLGTLKATLHRARERLRRDLVRQEVTP